MSWDEKAEEYSELVKMMLTAEPKTKEEAEKLAQIKDQLGRQVELFRELFFLGEERSQSVAKRRREREDLPTGT